MNRIARNIAKLPVRTWRTISKRLQPVYRLQREADAMADTELQIARQDELESIGGTTSDHECRLLYYLARQSPRQGAIVEIGAFKGKSTAWLAEAARKSGQPLISIDPHLQGTFDDFRQTVERFNLCDVATLHRALSHEIGRNWSQPIAFLWVDGGHDYDIVRQDIDDFAPHLLPGGYAAFDDVNPQTFPGVVQALNETLHNDESFVYEGIIGTIAIFRRR